jgi:ribonuclease HI
MLYGVPIWIKALEKESNRKIYNRVQRLINIKIAKSFRTTSNEALCTLTGLKPIVIQAEEAAKIFNIMRENLDNEIDKDVQPKDWLHPAETVTLTEIPEGDEIQIYTDGSKYDNGVGAGIVIIIERKLQQQLKYKLHNNCSNNQAEQMAIMKAIEAIENIHIRGSSRRTTTIYTDSRVTIQSLQNYRNKHLIEEIRRKAIALERQDWNIKFTWIKAHDGNYGNELADSLAKEATRNKEIIYNKIPKKPNSTTSETTELRKVANSMGANNKKNNNKTVFPKH